MTPDELQENVVALKLNRALPVVTNFSPSSQQTSERPVSLRAAGDDAAGSLLLDGAVDWKKADPKAHG